MAERGLGFPAMERGPVWQGHKDAREGHGMGLRVM